MDKTSVMIVSLLSLLCAVRWTHSVEIEERSHTSTKDTRKLFGGYRITPRYCQPTRELSQELKGPNICMFNHECIQRNGIVVGACMDGFLFGACCQLPAGSAGELIIPGAQQPVQIPNNELYHTKSPGVGIGAGPGIGIHVGHITSSGVSKITQSLLYGNANHPGINGILPTAADNTVVQINEQDQFVTAGVTHPTGADTVVVTAGNNEINGDQFKNPDLAEDRKTTQGIELTTQPYIPDVSPYIHISISNAPSYYTPAPVVGKPIFRPKPKPSNDEYVLVPTINHNQGQKNRNKTDSIDTIVNIVQLLNDTRKQTTSPPGVYLYNTNTATTRRPTTTTTYGTTPTTTRTTTKAATITTTVPRRTTSKLKLTTKKRLGTTTKKSTTTKKTTTAGTTTKGSTTTTTTSKKPVYQYVSSTTFRPGYTSKKPPSTSYVYSSTISKRPGSGTLTTVPGYAVTRPPNAPTIIVLGSTLSNTSPEPISHQYSPTKYTTLRPNTYTASTSTKHPVTVTINNHITQHIHNTSERPSPTVLITPKPSITTTPGVNTYIAAEDVDSQNGDNLINFPPVRNPNLNMSIPIFDQDNDITTPDFIEDAALDTKVESFVNKIIAGLQDPFDGLKDIVYTGANKTETTTKKPVKKTTTRKPTTRAPLTTTTTERVKTTTKKVRTTKPTEKKKVTTVPTTESYIEHDDVSQDYRAQCGIRPLVKSGRIVGGKGATFGEFPWQVLVRESTWLGLFTKNKCGGVLISNKYVMTAAHCQPGFLASLVAVFGEFDISGDLEAKRAVSRNVKRVIVHRQYDAATFENDLALLELEHPIQFDAHIVPICLPRDHEDFTSRMATVTGWGRLKYGGGVPSVLQEVQVPIMENAVCQEMFRTAGHQKVILESFLCAGYANGQKDSCEGDSGGPLVLQRPDGRYQLAGTVSHGIKCAAPYLPGVYMRTTFYKPWIESITGVH